MLTRTNSDGTVAPIPTPGYSGLCDPQFEVWEPARHGDCAWPGCVCDCHRQAVPA